MKKRDIYYSVRRLFLAFLTSMCQYILFGPIFYIYMVFIPWLRIGELGVLAVPYILIPLLSAFVCCFLMNRGDFHFDLRNMISKASAYRLAARLLSVFCFLLIGYIIDKNNGMPIVVSEFLRLFGEHGGAFESALNNFLVYIVIAIFPIVYALVEYLFVTSKSDYSTDS